MPPGCIDIADSKALTVGSKMSHAACLPPPPAPAAAAAASSSSSDPIFEYINNMLMDENSEDLQESPCSPLQQTFLHIFNGFHALLWHSNSANHDEEPSSEASHHHMGIADRPTSISATTISDYPSELDDVAAESRATHPRISTTFVLPRAANRLDASYSRAPMAIHGLSASTNYDDKPGSARGGHYYDRKEVVQDVYVDDMRRAAEMGQWKANGRRYPWEKEVEGGDCGRGSLLAAGIRRRRAAEEKEDGDDVCFVANGDLRAEALSQLHSDGWTLPSRSLPAVAVEAAPQIDVDLMALLTKCAKAVAEGNVKKANEGLREMEERGGASAQGGSGLQRAAFYFGEALRARMSGTGTTLMYSLSAQPPSAAAMLRAYKRIDCEAWPYAKLGHYFANQHILEAAGQAPRLHIVDYGISYGFQWPCLISALARRKGGPPQLRITGIEMPSTALGRSPTEAVERTGRRLAEYAKAYGVPFEFEGVAAAAWEDVRLGIHRPPEGEVLAINCMFRLRHLMDESSSTSSSDFSPASGWWPSSSLERKEEALCPRDALLAEMRGLEPDVVVVGVVNAAHSSPFFLPRFREGLYYYASCFDALAQSAGAEAEEERRLVERERLGREMMNVVACEGAERVERPETYRKWHARLERAGLRALKLPHTVVAKSEALLSALYHKEFSASADDSRTWMLLEWKGRPVHALSAWT